MGASGIHKKHTTTKYKQKNRKVDKKKKEESKWKEQQLPFLKCK